MADPNDLSEKYNTALTPEEETQFQASPHAAKGSYDYDMRGAWKAGAGQADNGHFPDTFKKPNHPTFSKESQYNGVDGYEGGEWKQETAGPKAPWTFQATPSQLKFRTAEDLQKYFTEVEAGNTLALPETQKEAVEKAIAGATKGPTKRYVKPQ